MDVNTGMDTALCVGKTLYTRNGDKAVITSISGQALTIENNNRQYSRNVAAVGKSLFTSNPLEQAAAEEYEGDTSFQQEAQHLKETQERLETFSGFVLAINIGLYGAVLGTVIGFDEVTKEELIAHPYFARMDIVIDDQQSSGLEIAYIGKKGVYHENRLLISDWRSEIGQKYYMKNITKYKYNGFDYELQLRRALRIRNSVLTGYENEFAKAAYLKTLTNEDSEADTHKETITDPFLQDIIRQKHFQNKLTDIIESIQENQNTIITYDENASLVVQGCAGSGKTMILLHRLSFIKYFNRELDLTKIKILTPNRLFSAYINDLSKSLELEKVDRLTVNEYYATLLTRYYNMERTQLGQKCTPNELIDFKNALLYKESAAAGWPTLYSDTLREYIKKETIQLLRYIYDNKIRYDEVSAVLRAKLKYTLDDNIFDMKNITILRSVLLSVKATFEPYNKQLAVYRQSEKELASIEQKFLEMKAAVPNADALLDEIIQEKIKKTPNLREQYEQRKKALLKQRGSTNPNADTEIRECNFSLCALLYDRAQHVFEIDKKRLQKEKDEIPLSEQEMELIENAYKHSDNLSIGSIENSVADMLEREYAVSLSFKNRLYTKLLIYYIILGKLTNGERLLCVDEGHDLYASEYRLFFLVNGSNLRYNIYGDINQILQEGEGVADWDNLYSIFDFTLFTLNENYRNSSEIIDYANHTLGFSTTNLGISGESVQALDFDRFIAHVNNNMIGSRKLAILVKKKKPAFLAMLQKKLEAKINLTEINAGEIAVLTPAEAKGLEFDTCYVMTEGMNKNEKYISFTRALNELYIITK